jgi:hypothetical protein
MKPEELELVTKAVTSLGENGKDAFSAYMTAYTVTWVFHYICVLGCIIGGIWLICQTVRYAIDKSCTD